MVIPRDSRGIQSHTAVSKSKDCKRVVEVVVYAQLLLSSTILAYTCILHTQVHIYIYIYIIYIY